MSRRLVHRLIDATLIASLLLTLVSLTAYARFSGAFSSHVDHTQTGTYVALGDSLSGGWGLDDPMRQSWPAVLAQHHLAHLRLVNLTTADVDMGFPMAEMVTPQVLAARPTVVTVMVGLHDILGGMAAAEAGRQLDLLLGALEPSGARIFVLNYPDPDYLPFFSLVPGQALALRDYNLAVPAIAARHHAVGIDIAARSQSLWGRPGFSFAEFGDDLSRPTSMGSELLADVVFDAMRAAGVPRTLQ